MNDIFKFYCISNWVIIKYPDWLKVTKPGNQIILHSILFLLRAEVCLDNDFEIQLNSLYISS